MKSNNLLVARFNEDKSKIDFYTILFNYKQYTILKRHTYSKKMYYAYDNKRSKLALLPLLQEMEVLEVKKAVSNDIKFLWLKEPIIFFWADSILVTRYNEPGYELLLDIYNRMLSIRETNLEMEYFIETNSFNFKLLKIIAIIRLKMQKRKEGKVVNSVKGMKIIW